MGQIYLHGNPLRKEKWRGSPSIMEKQQAIIAVRQRAVAVNVPIYMVCERADIAPSTLTRWRTQPDKAQWAKINRLAEAMTEIEQERETNAR